MRRTGTRLVTSAAWLAVATLAIPAVAVGQEGAPTTVFLVRHGEKEATGRDPSLTGEGRARARALARVLADTKIEAVYATQFARTRETGEPLADKLGLPVTVIEATADYVNGMATLIKTKHRGTVIVVVSHSNTVPGIIAALGATPVPVIDEDEYDDLYVVTIDAAGTATVLALHYGTVSP
jgi:broad specificity phosphatase PhoE